MRVLGLCFGKFVSKSEISTIVLVTWFSCQQLWHSGVILLTYCSYVKGFANEKVFYFLFTVNSCSAGQKLDIDPMTTLVMVVDAERPTITITGIRNQDVSEHDLSHGVKLFPNLMIDARTKTEDTELKSSADTKVSNSSKQTSFHDFSLNIILLLVHWTDLFCFTYLVCFTY